MKAVGIIPARYSSTRFLGKPLALISGKPMIELVYERAKKAGTLSRVIVATDDERIFSTVVSFGGEAVMTSENCLSGTDRIAEAAKNIEADVILNIQGDEPLLDPGALDLIADLLKNDKGLKLATLVTPISSGSELADPNVVKVVMGTLGRCLYFSRSPVPFVRNASFESFRFFRHIGIYGFDKKFLADFSAMPQGTLEKAESLEQLRALENGVVIKAACIENWKAVSVDTPQDLLLAEEIIKKGAKAPL